MQVHSFRRRIGVSMAITGLVLGVLGLLAPGAGAGHEESAVTPHLYNEPGGPEVNFSQNPNCGTVARSESTVPNDIGWLEATLPGTPAPGSHTVNGLTVVISYVDSGQKLLNFNVTSNHEVGAAIIKAQGANVYLYHPNYRTSDTHLHTPGQHAISHVTFCFRVASTTTTVAPTTTTVAPTTTTVAPTTTTVAPTTTTLGDTTTDEVLGEQVEQTTTVVETTESTDAAVLGVEVQRTLPRTGIGTGELLMLAGLALLLGGLSLAYAERTEPAIRRVL